MDEINNNGMHSRDTVVIYVVRHAEHVTPDVPNLSRKGSLQATSIAQVLKRKRRVSAIYCSPQSFETAITVSKELCVNVTTDNRLMPYDGGRLKGLSLHKVQKEFPEVYQKRFVERNPYYKVPDGESLNDRYHRVKCFLDNIARKHRDQHVVVVTHGGIIDDMFRTARSLPLQQLTGLKKPYGCLTVLSLSNGRWSGEQWCDIDHLPQVVAESPTGGQLYLFPLQVAGSIPMLIGDLGELCKPATQREIETYEVFKKECPAVAKFAPEYLGKAVIDVRHILSNERELDGLINTMQASPFEENDCKVPESWTIDEGEKQSAKDNMAKPMRIASMPRSSSSRISECFLNPALSKNPDRSNLMKLHRGEFSEKVGGVTFKKELSHAQTLEALCPSKSPALHGGDGNNLSHNSPVAPPIDSFFSPRLDNKNEHQSAKEPWSVNTLWSRFINHTKDKSVKVDEGKFMYLVMENITHGLRQPYIVDLKMGTQHHGPHESLQKIEVKKNRVLDTTSSSVGIRIGGMQIYDNIEKTCVLMDKYWGRSLNLSGLTAALKLFTFDQENGRVRRTVVMEIICQLEKLVSAIKTTSWRFYGCSLLIVYDSISCHKTIGNSATRENPQSLRAKSFSESVCGPNECTNSVGQSHDSVSKPTKVLSTRNKAVLSGDIEKPVVNEIPDAFRERSHSLGDGCVFNCETPKCVAVRLIDFAKTERNNNGASCDTGLLFGVENLLKILKQISLEAPSSQCETVSSSAVNYIY